MLFTVTLNLRGWGLGMNFNVSHVIGSILHKFHTVYLHFPDLDVLILSCLVSCFLFFIAVRFSPSPGAVYLEGGLEEARQLFGRLLFNSEVTCKMVSAFCHSAVLCGE